MADWQSIPQTDTPTTLEEAIPYFLWVTGELFQYCQRLEQQNQMLANMVQRLNILHQDEIGIQPLDDDTRKATEEAMQ
jgi:hypothetical protein